LDFLKALGELSFEEFKGNREHYRTAERSLQITIECCHDIANHIISAFQMERPDRYESVFNILGENGVVPKGFVETLVSMAKFRNLLVHEYLDIKLDRVYEILQQKSSDFEKFAKYVVSFLEKMEGN